MPIPWVFVGGRHRKDLMRLLLRLAAISLLALGPWATPPPVRAANLDTIADHVFGQPNFTSGTSNNGGLSARSLYVPHGMALDAAGNLYVVDQLNHRVLVYYAPLTTDATADQVFGQPNFTSRTSNNGGLSASSLNYPTGVALDAAGNLYVADAGNSRVLVYYAPLTTDTIADRVFGQPNFTSSTSNNGGLSASSLYEPSGVALDPAGNLFVADYGNHRVLVYYAPLTTDATADRVFGQPNFTSRTSNNGGLSALSLYEPSGVALDAAGNLYVADQLNHRVLVYYAPLTTDATADRVFGQPNFTSRTSNNGGLSASSLSYPSRVALGPAGNLYVADVGNHRVLAYDVPTAHAAPTLTAPAPTTVAAGSPPFALTVTGSNFVAGSMVRVGGSDRPTTWLSSTRLVATLTAADAAAGGPLAITVFTPAPGGGTTSLINLPLYSRARHDAMADVVQGQPGFITNTLNHPALTGAQRLRGPLGVAVHAPSGRLFVADTDNHRVLSWPNAPALANSQPADLVLGQPSFFTATPNAAGLSARSLKAPGSVALDEQGNLYVADTQNHRVLVYMAPLSSGMAASHVFGQGGSFTMALNNNGGLSANSLSTPTGVAVDEQGNLYVADLGNHRVLVYNTPLSSGITADRVFGQPNFTSGTANNGGISASSLHYPTGATVDRAGSLYVADSGNNRVLQYDGPLTTDTVADRVFGQPSFAAGIANNGGRSANSLSSPWDVATDPLGNLYVADLGNQRVLAYDQPLATDSTADQVFGQPNFTAGSANNGGLSASSLNGPQSVALDARGSLFVADAGNHRVLAYDPQLFNLALPLLIR
jgi:sugar lactone lactonase YvrE